MTINEGNLGMRNYYLAIDKSGSMSEPVGNGVSRWQAVKEYAMAFARECEKLDSDGIDVYTFNKSFTRYENTTSDKVKEIFEKNSPMGGTDFVPVLTDLFEKHFKSDKPGTVVVITDGEPSDGPQGQRALAQLIVDTTKKMESDNELGVTFIQVGNDPAAKSFLKKLDDDLVSAGAKFDIVDTKTCDDLENMSIQDVLLAAIND